MRSSLWGMMAAKIRLRGAGPSQEAATCSLIATAAAIIFPNGPGQSAKPDLIVPADVLRCAGYCVGILGEDQAALREPRRGSGDALRVFGRRLVAPLYRVGLLGHVASPQPPRLLVSAFLA